MSNSAELGVVTYDGIDFTLKAFERDTERPWAKCRSCGWSTTVVESRTVVTGLCKGHAELHRMPPVVYTLQVTVAAVDGRHAETALTTAGKRLDPDYVLSLKAKP